MSRMKTLNRALRLGAAVLVFGTAGFVLVSGSGTLPARKSQSAPQDPTVIERINQARGLQKVGKFKDAADILTPLAAEGHPVALYHLGRAYKNGWGVEPDFGYARTLFQEAARFAFAYRGEAAYEVGRLYQRSAGENCSRIALEWFLKALAFDNPKAHVQLAKHFERGLGIERDLARAFDHYEKAAIAGYPTSTINYARILLKGRYGLTPDPEKARFWAERAIDGLMKKARGGSASAAKSLGRIYRDGEFVAADPERAREWFTRSASLGDPGAMHDLAMVVLAEAKPAAESIDEALGWLKLAAKAKHGGAMTALGRFHLAERFGLGAAEALPYLRDGVSVGHPGAMEELARLYAEGRLVEKDLPQAISLAQKGADRGHKGSSKLLEKLTAASKSGPAAKTGPSASDRNTREG